MMELSGSWTTVARVSSAPQDQIGRWLHADEWKHWQTFRSPQRQATWFAGRWWAKRMILRRWNLEVAPSELRIRSRSPSGQGHAPTVNVGPRRLPIALSISHSTHYVAVTIAMGESGEWGVDLVEWGEVRDTLLRIWFADDELAGVDPPHLMAGWAAKEAAHKTTSLAFRPARLRLTTRDRDHWRWSVVESGEQAFLRGDVQVRWSRAYCVAIAHRTHGDGGLA